MSKAIAKFSLTIFSALMLFFSVILFTACGGLSVKNIEVVEGTLPTYVSVGGELDLSKLEVKFTFSDETTKTLGITNKELVVSEIDTSQEGMQKLTIKHKDYDYEIKKDIEVVSQYAENYETTYDGKEHCISVGGLNGTDILQFSTDGAAWVNDCPKYKDAGTYNIRVKIQRVDKTDLIFYATCTINKKDLTIMGKDISITYNSDVPTDLLKYDGFIDGEDESVLTIGSTITCGYAKGSPVGTYTITVSGAEAQNYKISYLNGNITVVNAGLIKPTSAENNSFVYDGTAKTYLPSGFDENTMNITGNTQTNAGTYTAKVTPKQNYCWKIAEGEDPQKELTFEFTITKKKIAQPTIGSNPETFVYDGTEKTFTLDGFDSNTMIWNGITAAINAGEYGVTITPKQNYCWDVAGEEDTHERGFLFKITPQVITTTPTLVDHDTDNESTKTFEYDKTAHSLTFENFDKEKMTIEGNERTKAGTYTVQVKTTSNYKWKSVDHIDFVLNITKRKVLISWDAESLAYTGSPQVRNATFTNVIEGDECYPVIEGQQIEVGSNYTATVTGLTGDDSENYQINDSANKTATFSIYDNRAVSAMERKLTARNTDKFVTQQRKVTIKYEDGTTKEEEIIYVGTTNEFDLQLEGYVVDATGTPKPVAQIPTNITVQLIGEDGTLTEVTNYCKVDNVTNKIKFYSASGAVGTPSNSQSAVGKKFRLTINPKSVAEGCVVNSIILNVCVVNGYNIYNAKDLSVITNDTNNGWAEWKKENGYDTSSVNSAVILQNNITVYNSDIPTNYFYSEQEATSDLQNKTNQTVKGSMKDSTSLNVYRRTLKNGEHFTFYGNYFMIDYSNLSKCVIQDGNKKGIKTGEPITTHTAFFKVDSLDDNGANTKVVIQDLDVIGNGERNDKAENSGGIILAKLRNVNTNIENNVYKDCYIGYFFEGGSGDQSQAVTNKLIDTNGSNCYNSLLYVWGVPNLTIEGGSYKGAGGPAIIVDHTRRGNNKTDDYNKVTGDNGTISNITVIGSTVESFVTGNEPWFVSYGASALATQLKAYNTYYTKLGSNFVTSTTVNGVTLKGVMNLKVAYKSDAAEGLSTYPVRGTVKFFDTMEEYKAASTKGLNMTTNSILATKQGSTNFENSRNGAVLGTTTYVMNSGFVFKIGDSEAATEANNYRTDKSAYVKGAAELLLGSITAGTYTDATESANGSITLFGTSRLESSQFRTTAHSTYSMLKGKIQIDGQEYNANNIQYGIYDGNTPVGIIQQTGDIYTGAGTFKINSDTLKITNNAGGAEVGSITTTGDALTINGTTYTVKTFIVVDGNVLGVINADGSLTIKTGKNTTGTISGNNITGNIEAQINEVDGVQKFGLSTMGSDFATVAKTGTTNLNIYIFNGMGIVVQLYPLKNS